MEIWKPLNENYRISSEGNLYSNHVKRNLKPQKNKNGYLVVSIDIGKGRRGYGIHQLVAIGFLGYKPNGTNKVVVDHINNIKSDNRLVNLRLTTNRFNLSRRGGASKYVGVSKFRNKWMATIRINNKLNYLGLYQTEEDAHQAYLDKLKDTPSYY